MQRLTVQLYSLAYMQKDCATWYAHMFKNFHPLSLPHPTTLFALPHPILMSLDVKR